jgi:pimeloyl-ACP methyl ester carboxylesterase
VAGAPRRIVLTASDGAELSASVRGDAQRGPRIVFGHGAGFAAEAFAPFLDALAEAAPVIGLDFRGHGRSGPVAPESVTPARMAQDVRDALTGIAAVFGAEPTLGVFHSISGVFALRAEAASGPLFRGMVLIEPPAPTRPSDAVHPRQMVEQDDLVVRTPGRRKFFDSVSALAERLARAPACADVSPSALEAFAAELLRPDGGEGFALACAPEIETRLYETNVDPAFLDTLARLATPGLVLSGEERSVRVEVADLVAGAAGFERARLDGVGHLMPLQAPRRVAEAALAFFKGRGLP